MPRVPCPKVDIHHKDKIKQFSLETGFSGWMYRILKEGKIKDGDKIKFIESKNPGWTIKRADRKSVV